MQQRQHKPANAAASPHLLCAATFCRGFLPPTFISLLPMTKVPVKNRCQGSAELLALLHLQVWQSSSYTSPALCSSCAKSPPEPENRR